MGSKPNKDKNAPRRHKPGSAMGMGVAIGVGVGAALYAATGEVWWIGVGAGVGAGIGAAFSSRRR